MGKGLDEVSVATPREPGEGVCAEEGVFGLFEDFGAFLTVGDFFDEGKGEDFD